MNLTSPSQVKAWCIEHEFHPNKTLGQNFLVDKNVLEAIVDAGLEGVDEGEAILEIGPGLGVMTEEILRRGHPVVAIEKDPVLCELCLVPCVERYGGALTLIEGDALDVIAGLGRQNESDDAQESTKDTKQQAQGTRHQTQGTKQQARGTRHLLSNLPYQAGTRILLELVQRREMASMTVLVQTEVAERLAAKEGGRERSLAGVWAQLDYDVAIVRKVSANCFWPRPEIGSSVVRLVKHGRNATLTQPERDMFHRLTKQAFAHRRKQMKSIFKGGVVLRAVGDGNRETGIDFGGIDPMARPETLSIEDWLSFARAQVG